MSKLNIPENLHKMTTAFKTYLVTTNTFKNPMKKYNNFVKIPMGLTTPVKRIVM